MARQVFPASLGDEVAGWIEARCAHGPGDVYGQAVRLTGEEHQLLEQAYAIDPVTGRRRVDVVTYSRRKGTRKSEMGAWLNCAEAAGPVRAVLGEHGYPTARPPHDPWIVNAATTEDQSDLVYGAFRAIVKASPWLEPLFDVGLEVTYLVGRPGKIELTQTRNPAALDGARPTFEVADEVHLWTGRALLEAYAVLRRNLRKRRAAQPWLFLPTTAYEPGQESIAEVLHEHAQRVAEGKADAARTVHNHREATPGWKLDDACQLRAAVVEAGGDAHWSDVDAIVADYHDPASSEEEFRRYWLNQPVAAADQWCPPSVWRPLADPDGRLQAGDEVALGFDGSRYDDATALVAVRIRDGYAQPLAVWERPEGPGGDDWEVPEAGVDLAVDAAFRRFKVCRFEADPPYWRTQINGWHRRYGDVVRDFHTDRPATMGPAIERAETDVRAQAFRHSGDQVLQRHVGNARKDMDRGYPRLRKPSKRSPRKIDAAVAWVIAHDARGRVFANQDQEPQRDYAELYHR